jgi:hypothetical protein
MSSPNLDLVRRIYAAVARDDYASASWADPAIEYVVIDGPEPGTRTGLVGIADAVRTMFGAFEDLRDEAPTTWTRKTIGHRRSSLRALHLSAPPRRPSRSAAS